MALQHRLLRCFRPEFDDTIRLTGIALGSKDPLFVTPGIILGRFVIHDRVKGAIGGGYQVTLTPHTRTTGQILPTYDHNWVAVGTPDLLSPAPLLAPGRSPG